ncbi:MAG: tetratricopeptide repeat protein [Planctomycetaceae bacterium]
MKKAFGFVVLSMTIILPVGCTVERPLTLVVYRYDPVDQHSTIVGDRDRVAALVWNRITSGEYEQALWDANAAIADIGNEAEPDKSLLAELNLQTGIASWKLNRRADAIACYSKAIDVMPDCWEAHFHRWITLEAVGDSEAAERDRARGMQLKPSVFSKRYSPDGGVI